MIMLILLLESAKLSMTQHEKNIFTFVTIGQKGVIKVCFTYLLVLPYFL